MVVGNAAAVKDERRHICCVGIPVVRVAYANAAAVAAPIGVDLAAAHQEHRVILQIDSTRCITIGIIGTAHIVMDAAAGHFKIGFSRICALRQNAAAAHTGIAADLAAGQFKTALAIEQNTRRGQISLLRRCCDLIVLDCAAAHGKGGTLTHTDGTAVCTVDLILFDGAVVQDKFCPFAPVVDHTGVARYNAAGEQDIRAIQRQFALVQDHTAGVVPSVQLDPSLKLQRSTLPDHKQIFRFMAAVAKDDLPGIRRDDHRFARRNRDRILQLDILFDGDRTAVFRVIHRLLQGLSALGDRIPCVFDGRHRILYGHTLRECRRDVILTVIHCDLRQAGAAIKRAGRDGRQVGADLHFLDSSAFLERIVTQCFQAVGQLQRTLEFRQIKCITADGFHRIRKFDRRCSCLDERPDPNGAQRVFESDGGDVRIVCKRLIRNRVQTAQVDLTRQSLAVIKRFCAKAGDIVQIHRFQARTSVECTRPDRGDLTQIRNLHQVCILGGHVKRLDSNFGDGALGRHLLQTRAARKHIVVDLRDRGRQFDLLQSRASAEGRDSGDLDFLRQGDRRQRRCITEGRGSAQLHRAAQQADGLQAGTAVNNRTAADLFDPICKGQGLESRHILKRSIKVRDAPRDRQLCYLTQPTCAISKTDLFHIFRKLNRFKIITRGNTAESRKADLRHSIILCVGCTLGRIRDLVRESQDVHPGSGRLHLRNGRNLLAGIVRIELRLKRIVLIRIRTFRRFPRRLRRGSRLAGRLRGRLFFLCCIRRKGCLHRLLQGGGQRFGGRILSAQIFRYFVLCGHRRERAHGNGQHHTHREQARDPTVFHRCSPFLSRVYPCPRFIAAPRNTLHKTAPKAGKPC